jgi:hypothetical protein
MFFSIDGGCSRISDIASQGAHHRHFFVLMVGALGSLTSPPRGVAIDVSCVDGGCSRISGTASQGAYHRCFLH